MLTYFDILKAFGYTGEPRSSAILKGGDYPVSIHLEYMETLQTITVYMHLAELPIFKRDILLKHLMKSHWMNLLTGGFSFGYDEITNSLYLFQTLSLAYLNIDRLKAILADGIAAYSMWKPIIKETPTTQVPLHNQDQQTSIVYSELTHTPSATQVLIHQLHTHLGLQLQPNSKGIYTLTDGLHTFYLKEQIYTHQLALWTHLCPLPHQEKASDVYLNCLKKHLFGLETGLGTLGIPPHAEVIGVFRRIDTQGLNLYALLNMLDAFIEIVKQEDLVDSLAIA